MQTSELEARRNELTRLFTSIEEIKTEHANRLRESDAQATALREQLPRARAREALALEPAGTTEKIRRQLQEAEATIEDSRLLLAGLQAEHARLRNEEILEAAGISTSTESQRAMVAAKLAEGRPDKTAS